MPSQRLIAVEVQNWLGLRFARIPLTEGVNVVAARNGQGKSALLEGIVYALDADYKPRKRTTIKSLTQCVTHGAKGGYAQVETGEGVFRRQLKGGKHDGTPPNRVSNLDLLVSVHLAELPPKQLRERLLAAIGGRSSADVIVDKLTKRALDAEKIKILEPLLVGGTFEAALKRCDTGKKEARGAWVAVTGDSWGVKKAMDWQPTAELPTKDTLDEEIKALREEADRLELEHRHQGEITTPCPSCGEMLSYSQTRLYAVKDLPEPTMKREASQARINELRKQIAAKTDTLELVIEGADLKEKAAEHYATYMAWAELETALGPDGVPGELWAAGTRELAALLRNHAQSTGYDVTIGADGEARYGITPYALCSESEQWRVNAIIRVALAELTGLGVCALDRLDVIDVAERGAWVQWLIDRKESVQTILAGTFKGKPTIPYAHVTWLEGGAVS